MYNRIKQLSNGIQKIWIGVFLLMAIVALAACGSDDPPPAPATTSVPASSANTAGSSDGITATNPSVDALAGGSPGIFL